MIEGRFGSGRGDLLRGSGSPKVTSAPCMEESTADAKAVGWEEGVQIGVMVVSDAPEEFQPEIPAASVLGVRSTSDPDGTGLSCAKLAIHEITSSGTGTICIGAPLREG